MSIAIENFVKAIYHNEQHEAQNTKPGNIAKKLGISNAAATDMAKKLALKEMLHYEKYKALELTEKGKKMALGIVRKHRLWEAFLFKMFDMSLHDIHKEAEQLEHQTSDLLAEKISQYLGHPKFDPHGEPIPNAEGEITTKDTSFPLSGAIAQQSYTISKLTSDNKEFFEFCAQHHLKYGNKIEVLKQLESLQMTEIVVEDHVILLHHNFSNRIYINPTP